MRRPITLVLLVVACWLPALLGSDMYVVQGSARGLPTADHFLTVWSTDALFYNQGAADREIRLLHVSNGGLRAGAGPETFTVAPLRSRRLADTVRWIPAQDASLWVLHLSVPDDVRAESSLYVGSENIFGPPIAQPRRYGKLRLPIFERLVPAGQAQVHLETHVGDIPAHTNVAIYNAGNEVATAQISIHRQCDDALIETRSVMLPPDTMLQVGGFATRGNCGAAAETSVYTIVTVDQPSLTIVSSLANAETPTTSISVN